MRDAQIYTESADNPDMVYDDDGWRDFQNNPVIDTVFAENAKVACDIISEAENIDSSNLKAQVKEICAWDGKSPVLLLASAYQDKDEFGFDIECGLYPCHPEALRISYNTKESELEATGYYLLNWNDEYLDMTIEAGPVSEEEAREILHDKLITRLVELNVANSEKEAKELYVKAALHLKDEDVSDVLNASPDGATIRYGGGFEERFQIRPYAQKIRIQSAKE